MKINGVSVEPEEKDGKMIAVTRCDTCKCQTKTEIPTDVVDMMKKCGCNHGDIPRIYKEAYLDNPYFYSFCTFKCDLCGEGRVLAWEAGNSPPAHEVLWPSAEIRFWPNYDYPIHRVRICKFCMPVNDDEASRNKFMIGLLKAMMTEEKDNITWKKETEQWKKAHGLA